MLCRNVWFPQLGHPRRQECVFSIGWFRPRRPDWAGGSEVWGEEPWGWLFLCYLFTLTFSWFQSQELRVNAGRKGGDLKVTEVEVSELNEGIQRLRAEIAHLKDQMGHPLDRGSLWGLQLG